MPPCDTVRNYEWEKAQLNEIKRLKRLEQLRKKKELKQKSLKIAKDQSKANGWVVTPVSEWKFTATKPYSTDKMEVEILDSGTIRIATDRISPANHMSAENFHRCIQTALGGTVSNTQKLGTPHSHGHTQHAH